MLVSFNHSVKKRVAKGKIGASMVKHYRDFAAAARELHTLE
jgi:hypothetical protein